MRKYNYNISERANDSLNKREAVVHMQKCIIAIVIIILISLGVLLGTSMHVSASTKDDPSSYNKYYTSIRIEAGDTLWSIADEYIMNLDIDKTEYITEICELNNIDADEIVAGDYIVVSYYSKDVK